VLELVISATLTRSKGQALNIVIIFAANRKEMNEDYGRMVIVLIHMQNG
jgi:hypothetical protein